MYLIFNYKYYKKSAAFALRYNSLSLNMKIKEAENVITPHAHIHNATLETSISKVEDIVVCLAWKVFKSIDSYMISCSRNVLVTFVEKPKNNQFPKLQTMISNSFFNVQCFQGYRCESGIAIFAWKVTWNYKIIFKTSIWCFWKEKLIEKMLALLAEKSIDFSSHFL